MSLIQQCLTPWALVINQFAEHSCGEIYTSGLPTDTLTLTQYLPFFLKTYAFELPFYYFFLRKIFSTTKILRINLVINLATHPFIFIMLPLILVRFEFNYFQYLVVAEIFAPLVEALILNQLFKVRWQTAVVASLVANLISWTVGVLLS
ncbi:MAG: hypothetical protein H7256_00970 [Bdellovibrio sp.]|nr:hypothetical protein [Bdellovibrio sp.]